MNSPLDHDNWVYHKLKLPKGKTVKRTELPALYKKGWADAPGKFAMGPSGFIINSLLLSGITIKKFWFDHWKWIITITVNIILGILALYLKCPDK